MEVRCTYRTSWIIPQDIRAPGRKGRPRRRRGRTNGRGNGNAEAWGSRVHGAAEIVTESQSIYIRVQSFTPYVLTSSQDRKDGQGAPRYSESLHAKAWQAEVFPLFATPHWHPGSLISAQIWTEAAQFNCAPGASANGQLTVVHTYGALRVIRDHCACCTGWASAGDRHWICACDLTGC